MTGVLKKIKKLVAPLAALLMLASCDVHEFPNEPVPPVPAEPERNLRVCLVFNQGMPIHQEIEYTEEGLRSRSSGLSRRYIIRVFPVTRGESGRVPVSEWIFVRDTENHPDVSFPISCPTGEYQIMVWSDFVTGAPHEDLHYLTDDFEEIKLSEQKSYSGSDDTREAFRGIGSVDDTSTEVTIDMERPMARYVFITTDVDQFIKTESSAAGKRSADERSAGVQLSDYRVRITYPRYMANSFNMFTDRPADSRIGVYFDSQIKRIDDKTAEIGFDYVFLNHHDTSINVGAEVYDRATGVILARIKPIDVPLSRSKLTIVRGAFLTAKGAGSVGINPDFDGEFNIEIK